MIWRQHTLPQLKRLLLQNQSILMPAKSVVRVSEIMHGHTWGRKHVTDGFVFHCKCRCGSSASDVRRRPTYQRMVLRQHKLEALKRLLPQHKRVIMPPQSAVCGSEVLHCGAWGIKSKFGLVEQIQSQNTYDRMVLRKRIPEKLQTRFLNPSRFVVTALQRQHIRKRRFPRHRHFFITRC
jgi:hypothetical protein